MAVASLRRNLTRAMTFEQLATHYRDLRGRHFDRPDQLATGDRAAFLAGDDALHQVSTTPDGQPDGIVVARHREPARHGGD